MRHLFLDLEDTVIEPVTYGWESPKLINVDKVRGFIAQVNPSAVHIFSFAVATAEDVAHFEQHVKPLLEEALGVSITHCPTLFEHIIPECCQHSNLAEDKVSIEDVCDFWGKQGSFKHYVQQVFKGLEHPVEVVLLDDAVTDEDFNFPALGVSGWVRNVDLLDVKETTSHLKKPKKLPRLYIKAVKPKLYGNCPPELGKYWGFRFGRWEKVKVTALAERGGTGSLLYAPIDKRGYPYAKAVALSNCAAFYGPMPAWGENPPKFSKAKLKAVGVSDHWLKEKVSPNWPSILKNCSKAVR